LSHLSAPRGDLRHVRPSPLFLALVAVAVTAGWFAWTGDGDQSLPVFLMVMAGWLVSVCLHEFAHAYTALLGGDRSVIDRGYLTLDPVKYAHPLLTIVLPTVFVLLGGIPLSGAAVYIDEHAIRSRARSAWMSASGPLTNLALGAVLSAVLASGLVDGAGHSFRAGLAFLAYLQILSAVLNLLPVPGLDGFGVIEPYLSHRTRAQIAPYAAYAPLLLLALLWTDQVGGAFGDLVRAAADVVGVPSGEVSDGYGLFRFWD
jgi:Zn-dependent protease